MTIVLLNLETAAIVYGLASAVAWGSGDFWGGLATRRGNVYSVIIGSQLVGVIVLSGVAWLLAEPMPAAGVMALGAAAGIAGVIGLIALYQGLSRSRMGTVAPVAAVTTAALPIIVALFVEGWPTLAQTMGFGLALAGVVLLSGADTVELRLAELRLPLVAGIGFGIFYILIDQTSDSALLWPLVSARMASISLLLVLTRARGASTFLSFRLIPLVIVAGIGDTGGNAFFALATRMGRLDIASVLASMYPAVTVLLAWQVLKERLTRPQVAGVALVLAALGLLVSKT